MACAAITAGLIMIDVSSLPSEWQARFQRDLYAFSYQEIASALMQVAQGRRKPRSPIEIEISPDLSVRVSTSPRLTPAEDADTETRLAVRTIERLLADRESAIRRIASVVAREQRAYFAGDRMAPRALDLDDLATRAELPRSIAEIAIRNKLVIHPRGISSLDALVDPRNGPTAGSMIATRPPLPEGPMAQAIAGSEPPAELRRRDR